MAPRGHLPGDAVLPVGPLPHLPLHKAAEQAPTGTARAPASHFREVAVNPIDPGQGVGCRHRVKDTGCSDAQGWGWGEGFENRVEQRPRQRELRMCIREAAGRAGRQLAGLGLAEGLTPGYRAGGSWPRPSPRAAGAEPTRRLSR